MSWYKRILTNTSLVEQWVWGTEWGGGSNARAVICSGATETNSRHGGAVVDTVFGLWSGVRRYVGFNYDGQFVMK